jgi:hypothetical protein
MSVAISLDGDRIVSASGDKNRRVWDAESGECLSVVEGSGDVAAIAASPKVFPFRAIRRDFETVIEDAEDGRPVAWFPYALRSIYIHPGGLMWAGVSANYVCLIQLEDTGRHDPAS